MFCLFNIFFVILALILDNLLGTAIKGLGHGLFYFLYSLGVLLPSLGVAVRRLHDVGKSGWFLFITLIPIIGIIWILILMCTDGDPAPNKYGLNPKSAA